MRGRVYPSVMNTGESDRGAQCRMALIPMRDPSSPALAGAGFEQPFELLEACHERVERYLALLGKLQAHLESRGGAVDQAAREAAADVRRYFNQAAPLHHEDEERHVFPLLQDTADPQLHEAVARLRADHLAFHARWQALDPALRALAEDGVLNTSLKELAALAQAFASGYAAHIACEHELVFPAVQQLLAAQGNSGRHALQEMGADMARRRGARVLPPGTL